MPATFIVNGLGTDFPIPIADSFIDYIKIKYTLANPALAPDPVGGNAYSAQDKADRLIITHAKWSETHSFHLGVLEKEASISRDGQRLNQWEFRHPIWFVITVQALKQHEARDWLHFHNLTQEILGILGSLRPTEINGLRSIMLQRLGEPIIYGHVFQRTIFGEVQYRKQDDAP